MAKDFFLSFLSCQSSFYLPLAVACIRQQHEEWEGRKRRMKLETRVNFDCGYVYTYTWKISFEVQHSIYDV